MYFWVYFRKCLINNLFLFFCVINHKNKYFLSKNKNWIQLKFIISCFHHKVLIGKRHIVQFEILFLKTNGKVQNCMIYKKYTPYINRLSLIFNNKKMLYKNQPWELGKTKNFLIKLFFLLPNFRFIHSFIRFNYFLHILMIQIFYWIKS